MRPTKRFGHRARMAVVTAASAGLVLAILFIAAIGGFAQLELVSARAEIYPALQQTIVAYRNNPFAPNLSTIVQSYPDLSVSVYDSKRRHVFSKGNIKVPLALSDGVGEMEGVKAVWMIRPFQKGLKSPGGTAVGAVGWETRDRAIRRLAVFLATLWLPMVALFGVITWTSARSTFEPLERLSLQAEALSAENLSARLGAETAEYAEFAERLNRFLDRLERSLRREERFVADAAHELRTPLTVMRGRLETALLRDRSPVEYRATLQTMGAEIERLSGLVDVLLQSATLVQGDVPPLELQEHAERAHARWVDRFTEKGVELVLASEPCQASILPREFEVIVDNLLSNALKASPQNTVCLLQVGPLLDPGSLVLSPGSGARIDVQDQGVGIPSAQSAEIFERFTRLDEGRSREAGGFGIGLSVCKRIAEGRGGKVYLQSSPKGAHFVVELPT